MKTVWLVQWWRGKDLEMLHPCDSFATAKANVERHAKAWAVDPVTWRDYSDELGAQWSAEASNGDTIVVSEDEVLDGSEP